MKKYKIRYSESFISDLSQIVRLIEMQSQSKEIARKFYLRTFDAIQRRRFGANCYEKFSPFKESEEYYRIYFGKYTIFYVIDKEYMDIRRMLFSRQNTETVMEKTEH